jgi:AcrR family transcriptional regulator
MVGRQQRSPGRPGRPPASSRAAIEEAAGELFLENSYPRTTIEQITTRAGVSRASFFNYFAAKSDLLWGDVDLLVDAVEQCLGAQAAHLPPLEAVRLALCAAAAGIGAERIPLAVTQWELMDVRDELLTSGLPRFARLAELVRGYLQSRSGPAGRRAAPVAAFAVVGAVAAAAGQWAGDGIGRGELAARVDAAVAPVCAGFAPTFA